MARTAVGRAYLAVLAEPDRQSLVGALQIASGDDWPVGVVIHHIAEGFNLVSRWIDCALGGRAIEDTAEGIDSANRRHAEDFASVGVEETVELLNTNGAGAVAKIRGLDEPDLKKTAWLAIEVEALAAQYWHACQMGTPYILPDDEIARVIEKFKSYGQGGETKAMPTCC